MPIYVGQNGPGIGCSTNLTSSAKAPPARGGRRLDHAELRLGVAHADPLVCLDLESETFGGDPGDATTYARAWVDVVHAGGYLAYVIRAPTRSTASRTTASRSTASGSRTGNWRLHARAFAELRLVAPRLDSGRTARGSTRAATSTTSTPPTSSSPPRRVRRTSRRGPRSSTARGRRSRSTRRGTSRSSPWGTMASRTSIRRLRPRAAGADGRRSTARSSRAPTCRSASTPMGASRSSRLAQMARCSTPGSRPPAQATTPTSSRSAASSRATRRWRSTRTSSSRSS